MITYSRQLRTELEENLPKYLEEDGDDPAELRWTCLWVTRKILRTGYELVMFDENRWTNDLYLCWESFAKGYPDRAVLMRETLELALNPVGDTTIISGHIEQWRPWIHEEIAAKLGV
jgi:hypothetical protein